MAETSTIFGFMKYVSATDILSDFKKTVDSYFVNSLKGINCIVDSFFYSPGFDFNTLPVLNSSAAFFAASKRSSSFL